MFSKFRNNVLLIEKKRPAWQRGQWNGVGGKVEKDEIPFAAMEREFSEETGYHFHQWEFAGILDGEDFVVTVYKCFSNPWHAKTVTDEKVSVFNIRKLPLVIPNLVWMIPMMLDTSTENFQVKVA